MAFQGLGKLGKNILGWAETCLTVAPMEPSPIPAEIQEMKNHAMWQGLDKFGKDILAARNPFLGPRAARRRAPSLADVFSNAPLLESPCAPPDRPFHR